jgi:lipopolysaccharide biosynthesis glycosyltransferase
MTEVITTFSGKMHAKYYYSKAIYFRVFIPEMFPEYDKAIYLDCDIVLNSDISELYNIDIGETYLGATTCDTVNEHPVFTAYAEKFLGIKTPYYFQSGVLLLNSKVLLEGNFVQNFFDLVCSIKLEVAPDQDYYNLICYGKMTLLPLVWNKTPIPSSEQTYELDDLKLVHYNLSQKPWRYDDIMYGDLFWRWAKETVFYDKILKGKNRVINLDKVRDFDRMNGLVIRQYRR